MLLADSAPGRTGDVRGKAVSNARRIVTVDNTVYPPRRASAEWGVRFGSRYYPDYATPHPTAWDGMHRGTFLTPDEADAMAEHLHQAAAWARAQNLVDHHEEGAD